MPGLLLAVAVLCRQRHLGGRITKIILRSRPPARACRAYRGLAGTRHTTHGRSGSLVYVKPTESPQWLVPVSAQVLMMGHLANAMHDTENEHSLREAHKSYTQWGANYPTVI